MMRWLPNAITVTRGLCGPGAALLLLTGANLLAFWLVIVAVSTDMIDGWLARNLGVSSRFGLLLDALSDKLLADSVWLALGVVEFAPWWLVLPMVLRDAGVVIGWALTAFRGVYLPPNALGQISVAIESIALCVLCFHGPWLDIHWPSVGIVLGMIALVLSLLTLAQYLMNTTRETPA